MDPLITAKRENILRIAAQRGIKNVRVFGSMCRSEATPDSDVDLLVELEQGKSGLALGGFLMDVSELLNRKVDVVTEKALHHSIRAQVLKEAVYL